jgi:hypothetical protein
MSKETTLEAIAVKDLSVRIVNIPAGHKDLGLDFDASPPRIVRVDPSCIFEGQAEVGWYAHVLRMPQLEIVNIRDSKHLMDLLQANVSQPRELWLTPGPTYVDLSLGSSHTGALYKHELPANLGLGFSLVSFNTTVAYLKRVDGCQFVNHQPIKSHRSFWSPPRSPRLQIPFP